MSDILAFKVEQFITKEKSSFSIFDSDWFVDDFDARYLNADGKGILILEKQKLLKALKKAKREPNPDDREMYINILNTLLEEMGESDFSFYVCS